MYFLFSKTTKYWKVNLELGYMTQEYSSGTQPSRRLTFQYLVNFREEHLKEHPVSQSWKISCRSAISNRADVQWWILGPTVGPIHLHKSNQPLPSTTIYIIRRKYRRAYFLIHLWWFIQFTLCWILRHVLQFFTLWPLPISYSVFVVGPGIPILTAISGQKSTDDDDFIE